MLLSNYKSLSESEKMQKQNSILVQTSFSQRLLRINSILKTDSGISITFLEEKDEKTCIHEETLRLKVSSIQILRIYLNFIKR
ncbi:transcriptional antiterminator BglG family protein [Streptococcus sanguinis SK330]|jgi:hypothetical protein|uniref:Transcriptional antiterminator BglG family protein n=1 Tax=Streptococcus sanguinis SK330 TaxID=888813 RepID=F2C7Y4_STRSA|nr:transcriptional antiterminator BglG family protein [Streptococcus sanguinis SK330]